MSALMDSNHVLVQKLTTMGLEALAFGANYNPSMPLTLQSSLWTVVPCTVASLEKTGIRGVRFTLLFSSASA